jgi:hypothetical protein
MGNMIRCIDTTDMPAFDRGFDRIGLHVGRIIRTTQHGIPVEASIYLGNHGKRKNAELLLSIGSLHFRFVQADVAEVFDGEADEAMEANPYVVISGSGATDHR